LSKYVRTLLLVLYTVSHKKPDITEIAISSEVVTAHQ